MLILARNWWSLVLRGAIAILFGILAFIWPGITVLVFVALFAAYAIIDGILAIISAFRDSRNWLALVIEGVLGLAAGIVAILWPGITALALLYLIAAWAVVTGIFEIAAAIRLRREISNEWLLGLAGLLSIVFGIILFLFPGSGALAVVWIIASYAILFGILLIALGLRLRSLYNSLRAA